MRIAADTFEENSNRMKSILCSLTIGIFSFTAFGQESSPEGPISGKITYEETVKLQIRIEGDAPLMADRLPKERKSEKVLTFTSNATLFEDGNNNVEEEMVNHDGAEGGMRIRMVGAGSNKTYTDLKNKVVIEQRDFMNRLFLVEKEIPETSWKITGNQKVILGYPCSEAVKVDSAGLKTVVWFSPSIKISGGPAGFYSLPGMILEVNVNGGSRILTAKSIENISAHDLKLEKPREGKKVTEEEFRKIVSDKMKEMGMEQGAEGGGDQIHIIIRH
jgi:GLPGLI family protein